MFAAPKWFAREGSEGSNNQHRDDTEQTQRYNSDEKADNFLVMYDDGHG